MTTELTLIGHGMEGKQTRRSFLKKTTCGTAAVAWAAGAVPAIQARGANERMVVGMIGCSGRGIAIGTELKKLGCKLPYTIDPDQSRAEHGKRAFEADHAGPDLRRVLDDPAVDAIAISAPNHWHAPAAILGCQAGKHVYVEKPCSHNIVEGRKMIEAARRHNRVMQVGTQIRGTKVFQEGIARLRAGAVGRVLVAKTWVSRQRPNIGRRQPSDPPAGLDYDQWVGPAPMIPYQDNMIHYNWHWWFNFGNGDAGSRGVHQLDIAVWGLDMPTHPTRISGFSDIMYFDDDKQYPDTQHVVFEYPADVDAGRPRQLIVYELRIWTPYWGQIDAEDGCTFFGDEGYMTFNMHHGWKLFGPRNVLREEAQQRFDTGEHCADFLDAIRHDRRPTADIEFGHLSATLPHMANILGRTGRRELTFDPQTERFIDAPDANALLGRSYREKHWASLAKT